MRSEIMTISTENQLLYEPWQGKESMPRVMELLDWGIPLSTIARGMGVSRRPLYILLRKEPWLSAWNRIKAKKKAPDSNKNGGTTTVPNGTSRSVPQEKNT